MAFRLKTAVLLPVLLTFLAALFLQSCGGSNSGSSGGGNPPPAPSGLTATGGTGQVSLSWTASSGATSYSVKRSTVSGGPYTSLSAATTASYVDSTGIGGTKYYFVVSAVSSNGESGNSNEASATPTLAAPATPTGVNAVAMTQQVNVSWNSTSGATSYNVKRSTTHGGPYTTIASPATNSYPNTGLTNGTTYYYVVSAVNAAGESANSTEVSATPVATAPPVPTGLTATPGDKQVGLLWNASTGATGYDVKRSATHGGPYTTIASPASASYTNTALTNGTTYYFVVSALNGSAESGNSTEVSATPVGSGTSVSVTVDVLTNRHPISPYIYGGAYPQDPAHVTDSGMSVVRWGGNATSTYNWKLFTYNADNDYYFEDFNTQGFGNGSDADSVQFVTDVKAAGSNPLMTMAMLPWVAKSAEGGGNGHWSFSVAKDGAQCHVDPYNTDAGDGIVLASNCDSQPTYITADSTDLNNTYFPLLDQPGGSDPAGSIYRNQWAQALAAAFGNAPHFYDMDNEIDIWGGTHRDIHPNPSGYDELANTYLTEAVKLKTWDPQAIRLGPVSCCWWFYWNGANGSDKNAHGGVDFLPWWLNQIYWQDQIAKTRSLDIFDVHAYPDGPDTTNYSPAQKKALEVSIYRDYWDPTLVSPSSTINQPYTTSIQSNQTIAFRIPRMRAIVNSIYPGTPMSFTEWSAAFNGEADFSTALADADAYGILGRDRVYLSTRWTAPAPANPNYLALKLYANYDGSHHTFGTTSVSDTNTGDPNLFSSYAALDSTGKTMTIMVLNKDPNNAVQGQFALNGFTGTSVVSYTLALTAPTTITKSTSQSWSSSMSFAPYTATLLVITGTMAQTPASEWDLNPDTIMVPANGTVTLQPKIISGTANVTLTGQTSDSGITAAITQSSVTTGQTGTVAITAGSTPGFYHYTVTGTDSGASQTQGGWIVVGKPAATLTKTGDNQTGGSLTLTATLSPGSSGGTANGASIFFTTDKGTLSQRIVPTNSSGAASVTLTLPSGSGAAHVTAEGPYGLGHPVVSFTESN
jgi:fibronectin type 3 domain-containing protein